VTPRPPVLHKEGQHADLYASTAERDDKWRYLHTNTDRHSLQRIERLQPVIYVVPLLVIRWLTAQESNPVVLAYCHTSSKDHGSRPCHVYYTRTKRWQI